MNINQVLDVKHISSRLWLYAGLIFIIALIVGISVVVFNIGIIAFVFPIVLFLVYKHKWSFYLFFASIPLEFAFGSGNFSVPKMLGLIAILGFFLSIIISKRKIYWDISLTLMMLFIAWGALSCLWSIMPSLSFNTIITWSLLAGLYFLIINQVRTFDDLDKSLIAFFVGVTILIGGGCYQLITGVYLDLNQSRLVGLTENANTYAIIVLVGIISIYWVWKTRRNMFVKIFLMILVGALGITFIMTLSRGGIISLAVFAATLIFFREEKFRWTLIWITVALFIWIIAPTSLWERFTLIGRDSVDRLRDLWPAGLMAIQDNPILGYGIGTSETIMRNLLPTLGNASLLSVHSAPLAISIDVGIPGIVLYLTFIFIPTFKLAWKYFKFDKERKESLLGGFTAILISGLIAYLFSWVKGGGLETGKLLWLLLGLESSVILLFQQHETITKAID